ncbi:MAG: histidinol-phosphate transaminase [Acidimicrobiia bacterium]
MPTFRGDLDRIPVYKPGKPIDEVSRALGITDIVKLASNEWPLSPFPSVIEAIAAVVHDLNRYPENSVYYLVEALARHLDVPADHLWMGAGSTELLLALSLAVGGPGTSFVFADPSFVMYPIAAAISGASPIVVPATSGLGHDLDAMLGAVRSDTTLVLVCNPNNPTATYLSDPDVTAFVEAVPDRALVVVDEAYFEFVTADDYASCIPLALQRDNVVVTRTFSKVYGLAGLRVGYAVGRPDTLNRLRRAQVPFSVSSVAQAAALAALSSRDELRRRVADNAMAREQLEKGLADRGLDYVPSQTNFVLLRPATDAAAMGDALLRQGVIVRPMGQYLRVTVGTPSEIERFLAALDQTSG